ncbi:MAG: DnaJ domain-containing protein, partial [Hyphomicrobiales bacterium]|nr:DnaJ domain-containing protein [Hyphomicrobiales bacterium]
ISAPREALVVAHPEDLEKLSQGPRAWNAWRQDDPDHIPDLRDAELTMSQRQFGPANGGPIDLSDADLQGMVLRHSTLTDASLVRANLVATDLVQARLDGADLTGADLTDAVLDYSDLTSANLNGTILVGASLVNVTGLTQEQIAQAHGDPSTALPAYLLPPENWFPTLEEGLFEDYENRVDLSPLSHDPYEVLGVEQNATFDEIRTAFRALVKKLHPDLNPDDAVAQERFKRVSVAYRILGDPVKRDRYNRGEIDADGDVRPEFEANKEFRRYAFKFYFAAAASLILAAGILGSVWYTFWIEDVEPGSGQVLTVENAPVKRIERLTPPPNREVAEPDPTQVAVPAKQFEELTDAVQQNLSLGSGPILPPASIPEDAEPVEATDKQDTAAVISSGTGNAPAPDNADDDVTTGANVSESAIPQENGSNGVTPDALATDTDAVAAEQQEETVSEADTQSSPHIVKPFRTAADELKASKPLPTDENASSIGQQYAKSKPAEAIEVSQTLSSASTNGDSSVVDQNNKLATLIKDVKSLVNADPFTASSYSPIFPSAHSVVLKNRPEVNPANDGISDVFKDMTMNRLQETDMAVTATNADSLQTPRNEIGTSGLDGMNLGSTTSQRNEDDVPEILVNPDAGMQFLLEPEEGESLVERKAVKAKTAERHRLGIMTQSQN